MKFNGIHNRDPLRQKAYSKTVQLQHQQKVLDAIAQLTLTGKPFTKQEAIAAAGLYITGQRAKTYVDRHPALQEAYQEAMQQLGVRT